MTAVGVGFVTALSLAYLWVCVSAWFAKDQS